MDPSHTLSLNSSTSSLFLDLQLSQLSALIVAPSNDLNSSIPLSSHHFLPSQLVYFLNSMSP